MLLLSLLPPHFSSHSLGSSPNGCFLFLRIDSPTSGLFLQPKHKVFCQILKCQPPIVQFSGLMSPPRRGGVAFSPPHRLLFTMLLPSFTVLLVLTTVWCLSLLNINYDFLIVSLSPSIVPAI